MLNEAWRDGLMRLAQRNTNGPVCGWPNEATGISIANLTRCKQQKRARLVQAYDENRTLKCHRLN